MRRILAATVIALWSGWWYGVGWLIGVGTAIVLVAVAAALAGYRAGRW